MTRVSLIEVLERAEFEWNEQAEFMPYELPDDTRDRVRRKASHLAPAIVEFVAEWLSTVPLRYEPPPDAWELTREWRRGMTRGGLSGGLPQNRGEGVDMGTE